MAAPDLRIVLLHGHGASVPTYAQRASELVDAIRQLDATPQLAATPRLPAGANDPKVLIPRGPAPTADDGWAWWSDGELGPDEATVESIVSSLADPRGTEGAVLVGFSQGGAAALAAARLAVMRRVPLAGVAIVAGFLPDPLEPLDPLDPLETPRTAGPAALPRCLVVHSDDDETVDPFHARLVVRWCERSGLPTERVSYEGGHTWTAEVTTALARWCTTLRGDLEPDAGPADVPR